MNTECPLCLGYACIRRRRLYCWTAEGLHVKTFEIRLGKNQRSQSGFLATSHGIIADAAVRISFCNLKTNMQCVGASPSHLLWLFTGVIELECSALFSCTLLLVFLPFGGKGKDTAALSSWLIAGYVDRIFFFAFPFFMQKKKIFGLYSIIGGAQQECGVWNEVSPTCFTSQKLCVSASQWYWKMKVICKSLPN